jgi:hypothetical protein
MVNGEQLRSQRIIGLLFTVSCPPHALRSALGALRHLAYGENTFSFIVFPCALYLEP